MMTDIEIAQSVTPKHILEIAKAAGVDCFLRQMFRFEFANRIAFGDELVEFHDMLLV